MKEIDVLLRKYNFQKIKDITANVYLLKIDDVKLYIFIKENYFELSIASKSGCYNNSITICVNELNRTEKLIKVFLPEPERIKTGLSNLDSIFENGIKPEEISNFYGDPRFSAGFNTKESIIDLINRYK